MNQTITEWIERLENEETILLTNLAELTANFPSMDLINILPGGVLSLSNITLFSLYVYEQDDEIKSLSFSFCFDNSWDFINKYKIAKPAFDFNITSEESFIMDCDIIGQLMIDSEDILPVLISKYDSLWSIKPDYDSEKFIEFSLFKNMVPWINFDELIEERLYPEDSAAVNEWELKISDDEKSLKSLFFKVESNDYNIYDLLFLKLKETVLEYSISIPFEGTIDSCHIEGDLYAGSEQLPRIKMSLPFDDSEGRYVQMVDEEYTINSFAPLTALLSGMDLSSLLPPGMQNFSDVVIRSFYIDLNSEKNGFESLSVSLKSLNNGNNWEIIPSQLEMKDISLDFYFPNTYLVLSGTVLLGNTALPLKTTLQVGEGILPEYIKFELNFNDDIYELPIKPGEISIGGFNFSGIFPGMDNFELLLQRMAFEFNLSDSLSLNRYALTVACEESWNPFSSFEFGNLKIDLDYSKIIGSGEGATEAEFYAELIQSNGNIPVTVYIPSAGEWSLELGEEGAEQGIEIPGLTGISELVNIDLSGKVPDGLLFEGITLADLYIGFPHPAEKKINNLFAEFYLTEEWSFTPFLLFKKLRFQVEVDFTGSENIISFQIIGLVNIAGVEVSATVQKTTDEWIFTIEDTDISLSLDSLKDLIPLASGISTPAFINNILDVSINIQKLQMIYNSAMDNLKEFSYDITLNKPWIIAENIIELKELGMEYRCWNLDQSESSSEGSLYSNLMFGSLEVPTVIALPFNSGEWTIQLGGDITIPQLSYFTNFIGFDIDNLLKELPGIDETPETRISRFDIKFDTDPYKTEKFAFAFSFNDGYAITLPPGIEVRLDSIELEYINETSDSETTFTITGAIIEKIGKETTLPVTLSRTSSHWQLSMNMGEEESINIDLGLISSILPGINLPSKVAESGLDIHEISLKLTHSMELEEFYLIFDLNGVNNLIPVDIIKERISVKAIYEIEGGQSRFGIQLLEWPFTMGSMTYIEDPAYEGWVLIDLGEFGALKMELPKFVTEGDNFIINGEIISTNNGEEITIRKGNKTEIFSGKELNIPIKFILDKMGLSFLNLLLPDSIPLTPEKDLRGIIRQAKGDPDNLPYSFQDYLDIEVPDGIQYDLVISGGGSLSIILSLPDSVEDEDKPLKILIPAGLNLLGMKIYNIGFSTIGGFPFLNLDIEFDSFLLPILVALSWFKADKLDFLVDIKDVNFHFNAKDVWLLLSTYIPIPIFYDDLSFTYGGIEGASLGTGIKFPRPGLEVGDFSGISEFIGALKKYITDKDYFLDPDTDLGGVDLKFTLGPTYAKLPEYLSGRMLGTEDDVFTKTATGVFCDILNIMKKPSLPRFVEIIPENIRFVDTAIGFGPINSVMKLGFTSVEKIKEGVEDYQSKILTTLFKDVEKGLLFMVYGHWTISPLLDFEVMLGMSFNDLKGAALQVGIYGSIGESFLTCKLTGVTVLDFEKKSNPFVFDLQTELTLLGETLASLETRIDSKGFFMRGGVTLIDWSGFKVKSELSGSIDNRGSFLLAGSAEIDLADIELLDSRAQITNNEIKVSTGFLGFDLDLYSKISSNNLIFKGDLGFPTINIDKKIPSLSLSVPGGSVSLGDFHVKCGVSASAGFEISKDSLSAEVSAEFHFIKDFSIRFSLGDIMDSFEKFKEIVIDRVIQWIKDHLLKLAEEGWKMFLSLIKNGWALCEDMAGVLKEGFGKSIDFITTALSDFMEYGADQICGALRNAGETLEDIAKSLNQTLGLAGSEISHALTEAGATAVEIGGALKDGLNYTKEQMIENFSKISAGAEAMVKVLADIYNLTMEEIAEILKGLGQDLKEVARLLKNVLGLSAEQVAAALKFIGASFAEIAEIVADVLGATTEVLAEALDFIKCSASEIASLIVDTLGSSVEQVATALKAIGKTASEVADALKNGLDTGAEAVAGALKGIGYSVADIAGSMKDAFGYTGSAVAGLLKGMGYGVSDIGSALSSVYKISAGSIAKVLNEIGYSTGEIAEVLYETLKFPAVRVADALKGISSAASDIASFFKDKGLSSIGSILDQVGFPDDIIGDAIGLIGCPTDGFCVKCPKCDLCLKCSLCVKCGKY